MIEVLNKLNKTVILRLTYIERILTNNLIRPRYRNNIITMICFSFSRKYGKIIVINTGFCLTKIKSV